MKSRREKIFKLLHELETMPERKLYYELDGIERSIHTFEKNSAALLRLLDYVANDPDATIHLFSMRNHGVLELFGRDVTCAIHNFVAGAISLRDHTRVIFKTHHERKNLFPDYQERVQIDFANDPLSRFIQDFRNYCLHYRWPPLKHTGSLVPKDNEPRGHVYLLVDGLLEWPKWSANAREFLLAAGAQVDLYDVVVAYNNRVGDFYKWFKLRIKEIHREEFKRFFVKEAEHSQLDIEDRIEHCTTPEGRPIDPDGIFLGIFSGPEFKELARFEPGSIKCAKRAIQLLNNHFPVRKDLKEKIIDFYRTAAKPPLPLS